MKIIASIFPEDYLIKLSVEEEISFRELKLAYFYTEKETAVPMTKDLDVLGSSNIDPEGFTYVYKDFCKAIGAPKL